MMEIISGLRTVCSGVTIGTIALELVASDALNNASGNSCKGDLSVSTYDSYLSAVRSLKHLLSAKCQASTDSDQLMHVEKLLESIYAEKAFGDLAPIEKGFMIENVSALAIANEVISRSDFVSVGTNDLLKSLFPAVRTQGYGDLGTNEWSHYADIIHQLSAAAHSARKQLILCGEVILDDRLRPFLDPSCIDGISLPTQYLTKV